MALKERIWREIMRAEGETVLTLSLRLPSLSVGDRGERWAAKYYERLGNAWKKRWQTVVYPRAKAALEEARAQSRPFTPWSAGLDFTVTLDTPERLSLRLEATEQMGGGRVWAVDLGDVWDRRSGAPLTLSALLPRRRRGALTAEVARQIEARLAGGESLFYADAARRAKAAFSPRRFYLTEAGPVVFYPMLCLGAAAEGVPQFSIPA